MNSEAITNNSPASNNSVASREEELKVLVELVWLDFKGTISRDVVQQKVPSLYGKYDKATVRRFIPLLVRREARDALAK